MDAILRRDALTETYLDVENLINSIVWKFWLKYGGEKDDWQAQADYIFVKSYDSYKKQRGKFSTWLYLNIIYHLKRYYKRLLKEKHIEVVDKKGNDIPYFMIERKNSFSNIIDIIDEAKEDGKTLIALILDPPTEMLSVNTPNNSNIKKGNHPCHMKSILRAHLLKVGWTGQRIKESFEEIGAIINA